jgi:hypothetical protein
MEFEPSVWTDHERLVASRPPMRHSKLPVKAFQRIDKERRRSTAEVERLPLMEQHRIGTHGQDIHVFASGGRDA